MDLLERTLMNRDALYRECAIQVGLVKLTEIDDAGRMFEGDDVARVPGGAWVTCQVYISNGEVSALLSRERKERRLEASYFENPEIFGDELHTTKGGAG